MRAADTVTTRWIARPADRLQAEDAGAVPAQLWAGRPTTEPAPRRHCRDALLEIAEPSRRANSGRPARQNLAREILIARGWLAYFVVIDSGSVPPGPGIMFGD